MEGIERMIMLVCQVTHPTLIVSRHDDVLLDIVLAVAIHLNNNELIALQDGIVWAILNQQFEYQPRPLQVVIIIIQQEVE